MNTANNGDNQFRAVVVTDDVQMKHALCIRAICFVEENGVPASQISDGNDYTATHFLLYIGDEPVGTIRVRWFRDFAKFERLSVRREHRNVRILKRFVNFVFDHSARKGYDRVITHAEQKYVDLWQRFFGLTVSENKSAVFLDGHEESYIEMYKILDRHPVAISPDTDATTLFRTEGEWDVSSDLETQL